MQKEWLSVEDVAEMLDVHPDTVRGWIRDKKLPASKLGNYRINRRDLDKFIKDRRTMDNEYSGEDR